MDKEVKLALFKIIENFFNLFGFNISKSFEAIKNVPRFLYTIFIYKKRCSINNKKFPLLLKFIRPKLNDLKAQAGIAKGHYFFQDLWAAKKIFKERPKMHIDIGSRIDGFITHLLTFMEVTVIDVRPLESNVEGLKFMQTDATDLSSIPNNSVESLSCLHAVEHFGLGRYGDLIDPDAYCKAMKEMARILAHRGRLYFSVPIGVERLYFNAHRVFSPQTVLDIFRDFKLVSFAAIDDNGEFHEDVKPNDLLEAKCACGLFEFTK